MDERLLLPKVSFIGGSILTALSIWCIRSSYQRFFYRIRSADYVTPNMLKSTVGSKVRPGLRIRGFVTSSVSEMPITLGYSIRLGSDGIGYERSLVKN